MPYSSIEDIILEIGEDELAKLTGGATIDTDKVDSAISAAAGLIDAFLYGKYSLPVDNSSMIAQISLSLSISNIYSGKFHGSFVPSEILRRRTEALLLLEKICKNEIELPNAQKFNSIANNNPFRKKYFTDELLNEFRTNRE